MQTPPTTAHGESSPYRSALVGSSPTCLIMNKDKLLKVLDMPEAEQAEWFKNDGCCNCGYC